MFIELIIFELSLLVDDLFEEKFVMKGLELIVIVGGLVERNNLVVVVEEVYDLLDWFNSNEMV